MIGRQERKSRESIQIQIIRLLYERGPMPVRAMTQFIPSKYKSVSSTMYKLKAIDLVKRDEAGVWSLRLGVTPDIFTGEGISHPVDETSKHSVEKTQVTSGEAAESDVSSGIALDQMGQFIQTMEAIGVAPKEAIPTIAQIFFSRDINSISWLNHVLTNIAQGYVTPAQACLMISWWARTKGLALDDEDLPTVEPVTGKEDMNQGSEKPKRIWPPDLGLGWRIAKDKNGKWMPLPGGPMTYDEALRHANIRKFISSYGHQHRRI